MANDKQNKLHELISVFMKDSESDDTKTREKAMSDYNAYISEMEDGKKNKEMYDVQRFKKVFDAIHGLKKTLKKERE